MKGKTYILTSETFKGEIVFEYNLKGFLIGFKLGVSNIHRETLEWIYDNIPRTWGDILVWKDKAGNFNILEVPEDLSFDRFWKDYGYKIGKKVMTENAWKKLSREDKIKALTYLPTLKRIKKQEGSDMPYPSTYLNQRYFDV